MSHLAAIVPEAKAPLELIEVETPQPGPHELLIKNELIALIPIDAKLARAAIFPIQYPAILGGSYGGTVVAVGSEVSAFQVGDKVAASKTAGVAGNKYGAFQKYVVAKDFTTSKIPENVDFSIAANLIGNLSTVISLYNAELGLDRPDPSGQAPSKGKKILVYGGTSSFGGLSVQYLTQAGYDIVTTTSPKHRDLVLKYGAVKVVDHTVDHDALVESLIAQGPYEFVIDSISLPDTIQVTSKVLAAQGSGGKVYALLPPFGPETLPEGITREYTGWSLRLGAEEYRDLVSWAYNTYLPQVVANGKAVPLPTKEISGGLGGLNEALDILFKGVSGTKVIVKLVD